MIISREEALEAVNNGSARFAGYLKEDAFGEFPKGAWIVDNLEEQRVDHVALTDNEPLTGCQACGEIVQPEADKTGCGCHCPECGGTL